MGSLIFAVRVEDQYGSPEFSRGTYSSDEVGDILGAVYSYLLDNGHRLAEPFDLVRELIRQVDLIRALKIRNSDLVWHVHESMPGSWFVADSGIFHVGPIYQIQKESLRDKGVSNWLDHLRGKGWVDYDEALYALETGYALLDEQ